MIRSFYKYVIQQVYRVVRSNNEYRTHKEHLNNQVKYSLNRKQNNKVCWKFVMIAMIKKNKSKSLLLQLGKMGLKFIFETLMTGK